MVIFTPYKILEYKVPASFKYKGISFAVSSVTFSGFPLFNHTKFVLFCSISY